MATSPEKLFDGPGPDAVFSAALARDEFKIQRCKGCRVHVFYPRALCPDCGSPELEWVTASGRGTVYATTVVRQRPKDGTDYNIALVELEEGPRLFTRVVDTAPELVRIGGSVTAFVGDIDGSRVVLFRPANGGDGT